MKKGKFELNEESLKEFSVSWNYKDYRSAVNILVEEFKDMNEDISELYSFENVDYRRRIDEEIREITGGNYLLVSDILEIITQEVLEVPIEGRLSSFMSATNINPNFAYDMFEKEIYPVLKSKPEDIEHFLTHYIQVVLAEILRNNNYRNVLLKAENLVNIHVRKRKSIGSLQIQILYFHKEEENFSEVIRMLKSYSNFSESKVAKSRILISLPYEKLGLEELEFGIVGIKEFIENQEKNYSEILAPLIIQMKDYLSTKVLNYALHSHYKNQSSESWMKEFIDNYKKEYIYYNDSKSLVNTIYKALDVISDTELREEGHNLISAVGTWESLYQNEDLEKYKKFVTSLEEMRISRILDLAQDKASDLYNLFNEKGFIKKIAWDEADKLVQDFIRRPTYIEISKYEDVLRFLRTGEWVFLNHDEYMKKEFVDDKGQDLTFVLACHFKAVETFLSRKIWAIGDGKKILNAKREELTIGKEEDKKRYFEETTLGNYYHFILKSSNKEVLKNRSKDNRNRVFDYIQDWANNVRNAHFHKDEIIYSNTVRDFRDKTGKLLDDLARDLI